MLRITDILDKVSEYLSHDDLEMIEKAYIFSASVHQGQVRLSGEPYLTHPMEVAGMLADMKLDAASIVTGILHDSVEDTLATIGEIEQAFGSEVAFLVEGLTKIGKITFGSQEEKQAENYRKMILAMSSDIRILLVRLADRVHNMRTLQFHPEDKQSYIAKETLEIHAPLANRLGINWMKTELEDLSFKFLHPEEYINLTRRIAKRREERERYTEEVKNVIQKEISEYGLHGQVEGRAKHLYSIFKKMREQNIDFDEVYDLIAFRIVLDSAKEKECYEALSVVHSLWKPVPGRFKDYIAMPKANNYRSLHTTVIGPYGERVEIQIRTREMHEWAEEGIAAHWRYKEGNFFRGKDEEQIKKLRELLDIQHDKNPREFMKNLKMALFPDEVYVFTPTGQVKAFPRGATPIDFAYSIHTDVGDQCIGAKVNRQIVPLKYELQNGDTVEITTHAGHHPGRDWLKYAVTSKAISKVKNWIKTEERRKSIDLGRDILEKELKKQSLRLSKVIKTEQFEKIINEHSVSGPDDLMALIGYGKVSAKSVVNQIMPEGSQKEPEPLLEKIKKKFRKTSDAGISITGVEDVMVRFARCCNPLPGDEVVGFISRGRGMSVHLANCTMIRDTDPERIIEVHWSIKEKQTYPVHIRVFCKDKKGLLAEISNAISDLDINIAHATVDTTPDQSAVLDFKLDVHDVNQLNQVFSSLRKLSSVLSVERLRWATGVRQ
ncbi:MAG TPA: bifunctional (p)ppGpp synthetase/guanosine-3',5'-bis(diphosphate) 3'-pyrophosphohydrolase [Syntrophales bacterium]|nr:bifunctional (p)ppGpp synthetase/guanosine-3',5'-bis(diphosphate) 3'-pyrophosphohydrolase [Syntrophales bacterium]